MMTFMFAVLSCDRQNDILDPPQIAGIQLDQQSRLRLRPVFFDLSVRASAGAGRLRVAN
jgi:hypothetical protein